MKTLFDIGSNASAGNEHTLLLEVGPDFCSYAFLNKKNNAIDRLLFYEVNRMETENDLSNILQPLTEFPFASVIVSAAFPQALLVPTKYFQEDFTMLDAIYQQPSQVYFNDNIPEWQMVVMYSLPAALQTVISSNFPQTQYLHAYTPTIKIYNGYVTDSQLSVHFTPQYFRLLLKKNNAIQLAQTYYYKTPLDVIYYLLNICYEFQLSQQEIHLILSGLVEKDSQLFSDLQQYFVNIHFAHPPEVKLPGEDHPHYFFTSLYNLAACVS